MKYGFTSFKSFFIMFNFDKKILIYIIKFNIEFFFSSINREAIIERPFCPQYKNKLRAFFYSYLFQITLEHLHHTYFC